MPPLARFTVFYFSLQYSRLKLLNCLITILRKTWFHLLLQSRVWKQGSFQRTGFLGQKRSWVFCNYGSEVLNPYSEGIWALSSIIHNSSFLLEINVSLVNTCNAFRSVSCILPLFAKYKNRKPTTAK